MGKRRRRPTLTLEALEGLNHACSFLQADDNLDIPDKEVKELEAADEFLYRMYDYLRSKKEDRNEA